LASVERVRLHGRQGEGCAIEQDGASVASVRAIEAVAAYDDLRL